MAATQSRAGPHSSETSNLVSAFGTIMFATELAKHGNQTGPGTAMQVHLLKYPVPYVPCARLHGVAPIFLVYSRRLR